jgi:hypothetical protein
MKNIKIALAILLLVCLLKMPYGYYQFVRLSGFFGFSYVAYKSYIQNQKYFTPLFISFAILFQPFYKIFFTKHVWQALDILISAILIATIFLKPKLNE